MKSSQRATLSGVGPRRAEIIVAGAAVFARLLEECRLPGFKYSPLGLRDGLLAQMAADYDLRTRSRRQIESDRWDAVLAAVKHYGVDIGYSRQVRETALSLFRRLGFMHGLPRDYQEWLSAAAMLHEVGIYVNRYGWHRHTYYVVSHSEIFGYTAYERLLIATITRYLGNSQPAASDRLMKLLAQRDRTLVPKAVLLLRMARALNQSRRALLKGFSVHVEKETLRLILEPKRGKDAGLELWALEKERPYFRELFGRELKAAAS
jgi:exopolyphosphatase/guanosine-5'-triphosphate,3'-diphosphate pyrophosphatase